MYRRRAGCPFRGVAYRMRSLFRFTMGKNPAAQASRSRSVTWDIGICSYRFKTNPAPADRRVTAYRISRRRRGRIGPEAL